MKNVEQKQKVSFKDKVREKIEEWKKFKKKASEYFEEHPEAFGTVVGGIITIILGGAGIIARQASKSDENCRIEDEYIGSYWVTDHPLTNRELMEVNNRMLEMQYENLGQALYECGYLKDEKKRK